MENALQRVNNSFLSPSLCGWSCFNRPGGIRSQTGDFGKGMGLRKEERGREGWGGGENEREVRGRSERLI